MTIHQEQLTIMIHRPPNTGLGISIAGGIGSTPYKDNDYVRPVKRAVFQKVILVFLGNIFNQNQR